MRLITTSGKNWEIDPGAHKLRDVSRSGSKLGWSKRKSLGIPQNFYGTQEKQVKRNNCFNIQQKLAEISFSNREFTKMHLVVNGGRRA